MAAHSYMLPYTGLDLRLDYYYNTHKAWHVSISRKCMLLLKTDAVGFSLLRQ